MAMANCNVVYGPRSNGQPSTGLGQLLYAPQEPKTGAWLTVGEDIQLRLVQGQPGVLNGSIHITDTAPGANNQVSTGYWEVKEVTLGGSTFNLVMLTLPERFTPRFYDGGQRSWRSKAASAVAVCSFLRARLNCSANRSSMGCVQGHPEQLKLILIGR
jgi:hypothetical protein